MFVHTVRIQCSSDLADAVIALFNTHYPEIIPTIPDGGMLSFHVLKNDTPEPETLAFQGVQLLVYFRGREDCEYYIDDERCPLHAAFKVKLMATLGVTTDDIGSIVDVDGQEVTGAMYTTRALAILHDKQQRWQDKEAQLAADPTSTDFQCVKIAASMLQEALLETSAERPTSPVSQLGLLAGDGRALEHNKLIHDITQLLPFLEKLGIAIPAMPAAEHADGADGPGAPTHSPPMETSP